MAASSANPDPVHVRVDGPCGTITLKSPQRRNAITRATWDQLQQALDDLHQEARVRAVLLTGQGDFFSSGTDLHEVRSSMDDESAQQHWFADANLQRTVLTTMLQFPKPIIAAVNGPALGAGLGLVAACDMVIAAPQARFGFPETQRGLMAGVAIPLIAFRLGAGPAGHLLLRGQTIDADEAYRIGLVHALVDYDLLWAHGRQWVQEIAQSSSVALAITKRVLNETVGEAVLSHLAAAAAACATTRTTEHADEGVRAFMEKRPPKW